MDTYTFEDVFANTQVECKFPGLDTVVREAKEEHTTEKSVFFPGCSFLNYALPLVGAVYKTLMDQGVVDGISLLCCGKILSYEINGEEVRRNFEDQLIERLVEVGCERLVCACPNCVGALRAAFARDERVAHIELVPLATVLHDLGYEVNADMAQQIFARRVAEDKWYSGQITDEATFNAEIANAPQVKFAVHDSCPDRNYGEFAESIRQIVPDTLWVDPEHCRKTSVCCGSLPRAAGKVAQADKCAKLNETEALAAGANAIVTPCVSCCFQLLMAQDLPTFHYLELLYGWAINWREVDGLMKLRFLFDETLGAIDERGNRAFQGINAPDAPAAPVI